MITHIMAVKDAKIGNFQQPFTSPSVGVAARSFQDAIENKNQDTDISRHPTDFSLWKIAEFNDETGEITANKPTHIMTGAANV